MSLLSELVTILDGLSIPVETGVFSKQPPNRYAVLTPILDSFELFADNKPEQDVEEVRISLYDKGNYQSAKRRIEAALLSADITITDRRYVSREDNTGYHHYAIDVAKNYQFQEVN
jgi:hypothetical protein